MDQLYIKVHKTVHLNNGQALVSTWNSSQIQFVKLSNQIFLTNESYSMKIKFFYNWSKVPSANQNYPSKLNVLIRESCCNLLRVHLILDEVWWICEWVCDWMGRRMDWNKGLTGWLDRQVIEVLHSSVKY